MYTFKIKLFQTQRTTQFLPKSFLKLLRDCKSRFGCFKDDRGVSLHANPSNCCHNLLLQMVILTEVRYLDFLLNKRIFCQKKLSSDFSYTLTYLTLKYERNRIFHPCRFMFDFYRQALLKHFARLTVTGFDFVS